MVPELVARERVAEAVTLGTELKTQVFELKSIGRTTLAIVKADGRIYAGDPEGLQFMGSVFSPTDRQALAVTLTDAQMSTYLEIADG